MINLNIIKEKNFLNENRRLSFPLIIDDLFNDITIRENLKRKYFEKKIIQKSDIRKKKQNFQSEKILSFFSKNKISLVRINRFLILHISFFHFAYNDTHDN